jgi:MSHA pilin protein MshA
MKHQRNNLLSDESGFTLIEIIAVLIILGILAAVAVPRYLDLTDQARDRAVQGALASGLSTVSLQYARLSLSNGVEPAQAVLVPACTANKPGGTDFNFAFSNSGANDVKVLATINDGTGRQASAVWVRP